MQRPNTSCIVRSARSSQFPCALNMVVCNAPFACKKMDDARLSTFPRVEQKYLRTSFTQYYRWVVLQTSALCDCPTVLQTSATASRIQALPACPTLLQTPARLPCFGCISSAVLCCGVPLHGFGFSLTQPYPMQLINLCLSGLVQDSRTAALPQVMRQLRLYYGLNG
jgi:hypothetical protein